MNCERCGQREATVSTFVVLEEAAEYWELCEKCFQLTAAEQEAAGYELAKGDPEGTVRQAEANLGRPLTPPERRAFDEHLGLGHSIQPNDGPERS